MNSALLENAVRLPDHSCLVLYSLEASGFISWIPQP
jgi:hypothetical protein